VDERVPVAASRLEEEHSVVGILAETRRDGTACGAGPDDDVCVALAHRYASERYRDGWFGGPEQGLPTT
jgi:hypothetical protein